MKAISNHLVDIYCDGMGEVTTSVTDLAYTIAAAKIMRPIPESKLNTPRFGIRITPFVSEGSEIIGGQLPHFHFRIGPEFGKSYPGFGWSWHHPWEDITRFFRIFK